MAAIRRGETKYTDVDGTPALKQAICAKFKRESGLDYKPEQVSVGTGGEQVLYNAIVSTAEPRRRGHHPRHPTRFPIRNIVLLAEGTPVIVPCSQNAHFNCCRRPWNRRSRRRPSGSSSTALEPDRRRL